MSVLPKARLSLLLLYILDLLIQDLSTYPDSETEYLRNLTSALYLRFKPGNTMLYLEILAIIQLNWLFSLLDSLTLRDVKCIRTKFESKIECFVALRKTEPWHTCSIRCIIHIIFICNLARCCLKKRTLMGKLSLCRWLVWVCSSDHTSRLSQLACFCWWLNPGRVPFWPCMALCRLVEQLAQSKNFLSPKSFPRSTKRQEGGR